MPGGKLRFVKIFSSFGKRRVPTLRDILDFGPVCLAINSKSDPSWFFSPYSPMRDGSAIANCPDCNSRARQSSDGRVTSCAYAFYKNIDFLNADIFHTADNLFHSSLSGIGRRFFRTLESDHTGRCPSEHFTGCICHSDDRIVISRGYANPALAYLAIFAYRLASGPRLHFIARESFDFLFAHRF